MKVTDLMLNDLVFYQGQVARVIDIYSDGQVWLCICGQDIRKLTPAEELSPIPITPEILEKSGFIKDEDEETNGTTYHILIQTGYEANSYTIQITLYKEPICGVNVLLKIWGWVPPYNGGTNDIHLCGANYVHELQHTIKICRIDKEITI